MIPEYSLMGPFRGHMSIKSSRPNLIQLSSTDAVAVQSQAFSPSSSCKLSSQYIIQDHMATHYRKLLSAKAAVDSSAPKSLNISIKYRDQQKREKLIKAVEQYKKQMVRSLSAPPSYSRSISTEHHKNLLNSLNMASSETPPLLKWKQQYPVKHFKKPLSRIQSPVLRAEATIQDIVRWSLSQAHKNSRNAVQQHALPLNQPSLPFLSNSRKKRLHPPQKKIFGGDLLQTHAQWFTETKQHFTPRVLKTTNKSFLSNYRYYNPPQKKKNFLPEKQSYKEQRKIDRSLEDECLGSYANYFQRHPVKKCSQDSVSLQSLIRAKEEELKYLQFLQEVTSDILIRSCYHKEALGDVFQRHIGNRRCDLDEVKMQRIFQALKDDLNISTNLPESSIRYTGLEYRNCLIAPYS